MSPSTLPTRITIDFRKAVMPSRAWILGIGEQSARVELLAFEQPWHAPGASDPPSVMFAAADDSCTCPEFCERDHANE